MSFSEVILTNNFPLLGFVGDRLRVRRGYARNFLIPQGIAVEASSRRAREVAHVVQGIMAKRNRMKKEAEQLAQELRALTLEFSLTAAKKGRTFGSVTAKEIFEKLTAAGHSFDRKQIRLREAIKAGGSFIAEVRLHAEVIAEVPVVVSVQVVTEATPAEGKESAKGKRRTKGSRTARESDEVEASAQATEGTSAEEVSAEDASTGASEEGAAE